MPRPPSDISTRIVHAARERFLLEGVDGASLRQIAKDADTNIGMVYYYFPNKDDLFLAVIDEIYRKLFEDLIQILNPQHPPIERIQGLFRRFGQLSQEEFTVLRIMIREALISSTRLEKAAEKMLKGHIPLLIATIAESIEKGLFTRKHNPIFLLMVTALLSIFPQLMRKRFVSLLPSWIELPSGEELANIMSDLLLFGISKRRDE
jgi:AcrR family transcriptional regulator